METVQVPEVFVQAPDQPVKVEPLSAVAERVTEVTEEEEYEDEQVVPQSIPTGEEVTLPVPVPVFKTARR